MWCFNVENGFIWKLCNDRSHVFSLRFDNWSIPQTVWFVWLLAHFAFGMWPQTSWDSIVYCFCLCARCRLSCEASSATAAVSERRPGLGCAQGFAKLSCVRIDYEAYRCTWYSECSRCTLSASVISFSAWYTHRWQLFAFLWTCSNVWSWQCFPRCEDIGFPALFMESFFFCYVWLRASFADLGCPAEGCDGCWVRLAVGLRACCWWILHLRHLWCPESFLVLVGVVFEAVGSSWGSRSTIFGCCSMVQDQKHSKASFGLLGGSQGWMRMSWELLVFLKPMICHPSLEKLRAHTSLQSALSSAHPIHFQFRIAPSSSASVAWYLARSKTTSIWLPNSAPTPSWYPCSTCCQEQKSISLPIFSSSLTLPPFPPHQLMNTLFYSCTYSILKYCCFCTFWI